MKLKSYLQHHNLTQMAFIEKVHNEHKIRIPQGTLAKWINGQRMPRKNEMLVLFNATEQTVTPNDFYLEK